MAFRIAGTTAIITTSAMPLAARPTLAAAASRSRDRAVASPIPARHEILPKIPLPVAGAAFVRRQRFEQCVPNTHRETALRLAEHNLRHQRLTAFEHAVSLGDA